MAIESQKLTTVRPQRRNANKHTQRGMSVLEQSIQEDGWIGAITVAADGETFDGSARIEVGVATGFEDAIVIESDGTKPIIHKRTDIPTADDPRAVRLGVKANRVAELNLDWDAGVLAALAKETDLSQLFRDDELAALLERAGTEMLAGVDTIPEQWMVLIECKTEQEQAALLGRFADEGLTCRALTS